MAYVPNQYEIDKAQDAQTNQLYQQIGQGVNSFIQEDRRRALEARRQQEAQAKAAQDKQLFDAQMGDITYKQEQRALPLEQQDEFKKLTAIEKLKRGGQKSVSDELALFEAKERIKSKYKDPKSDPNSPENLEKSTVPGFGVVKSPKEAADIRAALADSEEASKLIDEIKTLGTNVSVFDRDKINQINQKKNILAGKLRLPLTGPGAMTESEFNRLIDTIGDPSNLFGLESIEKKKLDGLKDTLNYSIQSKYNASRRSDQPVYRNEQEKMSRYQELKAKQAQAMAAR